jgi:hypothetical protein
MKFPRLPLNEALHPDKDRKVGGTFVPILYSAMHGACQLSRPQVIPNGTLPKLQR